MIEDVCGRIDYDVCGAGPTIVLVPGSCSTGAAWRPVISAWDNRFRCVTTSLLGYGGTAERRTTHDPSITHEAEMLESVIRRASGSVHLVGHSFGGLVAVSYTHLDVYKRQAKRRRYRRRHRNRSLLRSLPRFRHQRRRRRHPSSDGTRGSAVALPFLVTALLPVLLRSQDLLRVPGYATPQ